MIKKFVLNVGRAVIDLLFLLSFVIVTYIFLVRASNFLYPLEGMERTILLIYAVLCYLFAILMLVLIFYTIYLFVDIRDTLKEIKDKVSNPLRENQNGLP